MSHHLFIPRLARYCCSTINSKQCNHYQEDE